jgi:hypothetical protein
MEKTSTLLRRDYYTPTGLVHLAWCDMNRNDYICSITKGTKDITGGIIMAQKHACFFQKNAKENVPITYLITLNPIGLMPETAWSPEYLVRQYQNFIML